MSETAPGIGWTLRSPFEAPTSHWRLDEDRRVAADEEPVRGRRPSGPGAPVPAQPGSVREEPGLYGAGELFALIAELREAVGRWREAGWPQAHPITRRFLEHWASPDVTPRPFWCQREAVETLIWLEEAGARDDPDAHASAMAMLAEANSTYNDGIPRMCVKMATGTGKTHVMAMLLAWRAARTSRNQLSALVLCPTTTIRNQLNKRLPELAREHAPPASRHRVKKKLTVKAINFQSFRPNAATKLIPGEPSRREMAAAGVDPEEHRESEEEMLDRLLRKGGGNVEWVVLNDEAHHCWYAGAFHGKSSGKSSEEKRESRRRDMWFSAVRLVRASRAAGTVYDFSATPFFIGGPADVPPLFPWVVSDWPLLEAIESGQVKVPTVPIRGDEPEEKPAARNIYEFTQADNRRLDRKRLADPLATYLRTLAGHWETEREEWESRGVNPVLIVVANDIPNASALAHWIAGGTDDGGKTWTTGNLAPFANVRTDGSGAVEHPKTLLIHSRMGEEDQSTDEKKSVSGQAAIHCGDLYSGEDRETPPSAAAIDRRLRCLLDTAGQPGRNGQHIRCIVSVSMLTEGWDAKSVTHILGFRGFGTELLCEQVTGRALRRPDVSEFGDARPPELHAHVFGVPFEFLPTRGRSPAPVKPTYVYQSVEERHHLSVVWPVLDGYRLSVPRGPAKRLRPDRAEKWTRFPRMDERTEVASVTSGGEVIETDLWTFERAIWELASLCVTEALAAMGGNGDPVPARGSLFVSLLEACREWWDVQTEHHGRRPPPQQLGPAEAREVLRCCQDVDDRSSEVFPVFGPGAEFHSENTGNRRYRSAKWDHRHETTNSEIDWAPCDSGPEKTVAEVLDRHPGVAAWARNEGLRWSIPWNDKGQWRKYLPDFIARGTENQRLVIEFKGIEDDDAVAKKRAAENWWIPAVNRSDDPACEGDWRYVYLTDPKKSKIRRAITEALSA